MRSVIAGALPLYGMCNERYLCLRMEQSAEQVLRAAIARGCVIVFAGTAFARARQAQARISPAATGER
jgi:hypothetical protein